MTLAEFKNWINRVEETYKYQLLGRMKSDCLYFLGYGNRSSQLWGGTIIEHIEYMQVLYSLIIEKPEWLTNEEIEQFKQNMLETSKGACEICCRSK